MPIAFSSRNQRTLASAAKPTLGRAVRLRRTFRVNAVSTTDTAQAAQGTTAVPTTENDQAPQATKAVITTEFQVTEQVPATDEKPTEVQATEQAPATNEKPTEAQATEQTPATNEKPKPSTYNLRLGYEDAVMFQSFGWSSCQKQGWYKVIQSKIPDLQKLNITHLWMPPSSQSVSAEGYMPGQLYNLSSKYGNKEQLVEVNKALKQAGIAPVADIVINHRCADEKVDGVWNKFRDDVDHNNLPIDWGKWAITGDDPVFQGTGNPDTGDDYGPAPDLDHANTDLRAALKEWLGWLQHEIGFEGWRFDYVKGYAAEFTKEYCEATVGGDVLNVGEFWVDANWNGGELDFNQDASRQRLVDWVNKAGKTSAAFDFPTKAILQEACRHTQYNRLRDKDGKAPGLLGWMPGYAVTFVDNHDTGSTQQHWPFPAESVAVGYAYIITHPGIPCIFWEHYFDWGEDLQKQISNLVALRQRCGIKARSKLKILAADHDMYVATIDDKIMVKLGPRFDMGDLVPKESEGWKVAQSGKDYAVWAKE